MGPFYLIIGTSWWVLWLMQYQSGHLKTTGPGFDSWWQHLSSEPLNFQKSMNNTAHIGSTNRHDCYRSVFRS